MSKSRRRRAPSYEASQLYVDVWEERDRLHIALYGWRPARDQVEERYTGDGTLIAEWWDDDARQMFEDGFFDSRHLQRSVIQYAYRVGLVRDPRRMNPVTKKARRFIGRKIRKLAHEGVPAPRRIAAAYGMARRRGFKVPRTNPVEEEGPAEHIRNALTMLLHGHHVPLGDPDRWEYDREVIVAIKQRLELALHQVESGVVISGVAGAPRKGYHRRNNPTLAILGNPLVRKPVGTLKADWGKLEYIRPDDPDGKNIVRVHEFEDGFYATGLDDGSVHLWRRDGKALFVMQ